MVGVYFRFGVKLLSVLSRCPVVSPFDWRNDWFSVLVIV